MSEFKNGDSVLFGRDDRVGVYVAEDKYNKCHVIYSGGEYHFCDAGDFTRQPKKEKRLIAIHPETSGVFVATSAYIANDGFQIIEIEIEV